MKVITVNEEGFWKMCQCLEKEVLDSGYMFDTLVGIARAGVYVADRFDAENKFIITSQRSGTSAKKGILVSILRVLPAFVNGFLRCVEAKWLEMKDSFRNRELKKIDLDPLLRERLAQGACKVLVVDDAVDSGLSLLSVVEAMKIVSNDNEIRTAVITVTRKEPMVEPDYALFRDSTLIRFPWAVDVAREALGVRL